MQADWVGRQCFPQTAQGDYLDKHAQLRGLERRAATAAVGVLSFETDHPPEADLSIPEGTVCMTAAQVRFETTEAVSYTHLTSISGFAKLFTGAAKVLKLK